MATLPNDLYTFFWRTGTNSPDSGGDWRWRINITLLSQSQPNNTSTIRIRHYIQFRNQPAGATGRRWTCGNRINSGTWSLNQVMGVEGFGNPPAGNSEALVWTQDRTISHNSDGTRSIFIQGRGGYYQTYTGGGWYEWIYTSNISHALPTIPRTANITSYSATVQNPNQISVSWGASATCDRVRYRLNNGSWVTASGQSGTSGSFTISGLNPNTSYGVQIEVRRTDSQLTTTSSTLNETTHRLSTKTSSRNFNIGADIPITISRQNSDYTHTVVLRCRASSNDSWTTIKTKTGVGASATMTLTSTQRNNIYQLIPNQTTCQTEFRVETFKGGTSYGTTTTTGTATVVDSNPIFSNFTYEDINATTLALTEDNQSIIKGYSTVRAIITEPNKATAQNFANMSKYRFVVGEKQTEENWSDTETVNLDLSSIDNNVFTVWAIDSRNLSTSKQINASTYLDYTSIVIASGNANRGSGGVGKDTTLSFNGSIWNDNFGSVTNSIKSAKYRFKKTNEAEYGDWSSDLTVSTNGNEYSFEGLIAGDDGAEGFSVQNSFNIQISVEDELSTHTFNLILGSGSPSMALHQGGMAINQPYDETKDDGAQVKGKLYINDEELNEDYLSNLKLNNFEYKGVLPNGVGDNAYWQALEPGIYFATSSTTLSGTDSSGKPSSWGIVTVQKGGVHDIAVIWIRQSEGTIFRMSMNNNTVLSSDSWKPIYTPEDWIPIPLETGVTATSWSNGTPAYRIVGDRVEIRGTVQVSGNIPAGYRGVLLSTLPVEARPGSSVQPVVATGGGSRGQRLEINANGTIYTCFGDDGTWANLDHITYWRG